MLIKPPEFVDITEQIPIKAIYSLVMSLNRHENDDTQEKIVNEVLAFMNRCLILCTIGEGPTELKKQFKDNFDLWKKFEVTQDLFLKSSEIKKFYHLIASLIAEYELRGYISPMTMTGDFAIPDFITNVVMQISLKISRQVDNKILIMDNDSIKELGKNIKMNSIEDELINNFEWEQKSFTNGCGKLDFKGSSTILKPISKNFFKSLISGNNKGQIMFLKELLIDKNTILSFHPEKLVSSEFPKDKQVWVSYFLNESIFIGFSNIETDILGLPLEKLKIKEENLEEEFFNTNFLLLGQSINDMTLLNLKNKKIFRIPKIVLYACRAINFFITQNTKSTSDNSEMKGPWG